MTEWSYTASSLDVLGWSKISYADNPGPKWSVFESNWPKQFPALSWELPKKRCLKLLRLGHPIAMHWGDGFQNEIPFPLNLTVLFNIQLTKLLSKNVHTPTWCEHLDDVQLKSPAKHDRLSCTIRASCWGGGFIKWITIAIWFETAAEIWILPSKC